MEHTFESMMLSFLGREIDGIEFADDDKAIYIVLNDGSEMEISVDEEGDLAIARLEPEAMN